MSQELNLIPQMSENEVGQSVDLASPLDLPIELFKEGLERRSNNRAMLLSWIRSALTEGVDFGIIPTKNGNAKKSLWKPGAEKIAGMLGVVGRFTFQDLDSLLAQGVIPEYVVVHCQLVDTTSRVLAQGVGARSLKKDYGDLNKALKMAEKSAHIDAVLRLGGLSEVFTQDIEDMPAEASVVRSIKPAASSSISTITVEQVQRLQTRIHALNLQETRVLNWTRRKWSVTRLSDLTAQQASQLWQNLNAWASEQQRPIENRAG
ncbi:hypothetical protein [Thiocapsa marina]|uniref:Uncharacterized protein n=1 Tax=Thiocapsa marina 5811 TaxID=768671 RepID=F9UH31_9GAMM|nr:hypothetical protein [Thiocapsa marina]EGV16435.1 hypothetical protein ThimaDRAFT_4204 [Thiocapsa marina 5811]